MFLQGNLQVVFDALYEVGAIDPVLKMDWDKIIDEMTHNPHQLTHAFKEINSCRGNRDQIIQKLHQLDPQSVNYIAMEVAREFCEFQDRKALH